MRQLFPNPVDSVDPVMRYAADQRPRPAHRPWLMVNMITSIDGGVSIDGVSGGLGGPADKAVFSAIRGVADHILVGSGTVVAENYRQPQTSAAIQEARVARGQEPIPRIVIVTGRLSLPADHRVFDSDARPIIITQGSAPRDARAELSGRADIIDAGADRVDLDVALKRLGELGSNVVLAEGGPILNGSLLARDLVDEFCVSVSPVLLGGRGPRIVTGDAPEVPRRMRLDRTLHDDGLSFHRYVRA